MLHFTPFFFFFFFNDTATTEIYTLSLHDALPICFLHRSPTRAGNRHPHGARRGEGRHLQSRSWPGIQAHTGGRSEEHTSELQSRLHLVCRLLLEKKKKKGFTAIRSRQCCMSHC